MAKILKHGKIPVRVANDTCSKCKSLIQYERSDIKCSPRCNEYVICPVCGSSTDTNVLKWVELFHD